MENNILNCPHCGGNIHPGDQVCVHCGEKILNVSFTISNLSSKTNKPLNYKKNIFRNVLVCSLLVVFTILFVFCIVYFGLVKG